jgi:lysophospholipase L1-like esterase
MIVNGFVFVLILILLAASVGAIVVLSIYLKRYLRGEIDVKRCVYADLNRSASPGGIVFLGDSLTEFYRTEEFFHGAGIYNRGIASDTTDGVLARLQDNVVTLHPVKLFLQIGINDFGRRRSPEEIVANIGKIVSILQAELPETRLHLISLYPINKEANLYSAPLLRHHSNAGVEAVNRGLEELCARLGLAFIDVAASLRDERGNLRKDYTVEGLHISFMGYMKITEVLRPYVMG